MAVVVATLTARAVEEPTKTSTPTATQGATSTPEATPTPASTSTPPPTAESAATDQNEGATPTGTSTPEASPTAQQATSTPTQVVPTAVPATSTPDASSVLVMDARVVYHDGFSQGSVGFYEPGAFPWLDLLVQLDGVWYGPERQPGDGIEASPLPEAYRWEATGSFQALANGEAWWTESGTKGTARLVGPGGAVMVELPIEVVFRSGGGGGDGGSPDPGPQPTPT